MVFLFLVCVDLVSAPPYCRGDVVHFIVAFLLIIGRCRHLPLVRLAVVDLHLTEFGPHVLETNLVKAKAPDLNLEMFVLSEVTRFV